MLEGVSVPFSQLFGTRRQGTTRLQRRRQPQRQYTARIQPTLERLDYSVGRSSTSTAPSRPAVLVPFARATSRYSSNQMSQPPSARRQLYGGNLRAASTQERINQRRRSRSGSTPSKVAPLLHGLRLLILGVGIGAIAGTLLSVLSPDTRITAGVARTATSQNAFVQKQTERAVNAAEPSLELKQEVVPLKIAVQQLAAQNLGLMPGVFFADLDSGAYMDLNGTETFPAASMIKFPVLVALFQDVDAGKIRLDEVLTMQPEMVAGGSGDMQYKPVGTKLTTSEVANKMITISDNTATNMLIARLGGAEALNQRFQSWNLTATRIHNALPDLTGTNTTTPKELADLMALVNRGDLVTLRSRDRLLEIMRRTVTDSLLPRGLGEGAMIAHKTGDIGSMVGDVGLVDMPSGKRYIAAVMVKRPYNDSRAQDLIRQVSRMGYEQFSKL